MGYTQKVALVVGVSLIVASSAVVVALANRGSSPSRAVATRPSASPSRSASVSPSAGTKSSNKPTATATPATTPTATPTPISTPRPTPTASRTPVATAPPTTYVAYFNTLPPGSALPSDAQCASEIAPNAWEPRPANAAANHTNDYAQGYRFQSSYFATYAPSYTTRVTGNFTGTTDQILRWAACKWGFDENTVRAQAVIESYWNQSTLGDCGGTTQPQTHGCASLGILQVRGADIPPTHPGTWPAAWNSTAFNADYAMAIRRMCYEGKETWLSQFNSSYGAGDLWGCIGRWYSGRWHDAGAQQYIAKVQAADNAKTWTTF